jgi:hypothetical protein
MRFPGAISMPNYFLMVTIGDWWGYFGRFRRLAPLDGDKRLSQRMVENIIRHTYWNDLKSLLHVVWDLSQVFFVIFGIKPSSIRPAEPPAASP